MGEVLIVGGEYSSDYLFVDTIDAEDKLKEVLKGRDEKAYAFTEGGTLSEPLFELMREVNICRGVDEYEIYDSGVLRTYIQTLWYVEIITGKYMEWEDVSLFTVL